MIRSMVPSDVEPVVCIERESDSPWTSAQVREELDRSNSLSFIVVDGAGEVCGWCCGRYVADEAELLKIAVASRMRRGGVGSMLLACLCSALSDKNVSQIYLEVRSQNRSALAFYAAFGFQQVAQRVGYYRHPDDDALIMKRVLPLEENYIR